MRSGNGELRARIGGRGRASQKRILRQLGDQRTKADLPGTHWPLALPSIWACQVFCVNAVTGVLFRHNMFDVMDQLAILLVQPAVFATLTCPQTYEVPGRRIHVLLRIGVEMLPDFKLEDRDEIRCVDQRLVFGAFVVTERTLIGLLSERVDSFLNWLGDLQLDYSARGFRVETAA